MDGVSGTEVVSREIVVSSPLAGQLKIPGAQLITVVTLVTKAVDIWVGSKELDDPDDNEDDDDDDNDVGAATGCEVNTSEFVKMPPTTLLGCISGVANTCPVGPYIKSAASSILPSSLA